MYDHHDDLMVYWSCVLLIMWGLILVGYGLDLLPLYVGLPVRVETMDNNSLELVIKPVWFIVIVVAAFWLGYSIGVVPR